MTNPRPNASSNLPLAEITRSWLHASVIEPTGQLSRLCGDIYHRLNKSGLWRDKDHRLGLSLGFPRAIIVDSTKCKTDKLRNDSVLASLGRPEYQDKAFNVTEIHRQYENYTFASHFSLERSSICEMGLEHMIRDDGAQINQAYREVANIALPGFCEALLDNGQGCHLLPVGENGMWPPPYIEDELLGQPSEPLFHLFRTVRSESRKLRRGAHFGGETL